MHSLPNIEMSKFKTLARSSYIVKVQELVRVSTSDNRLNSIIAEEFCDSTRQIGPMCKSVPELRYLAHMQKIASLAVTDPAQSMPNALFRPQRVLTSPRRT